MTLTSDSNYLSPHSILLFLPCTEICLCFPNTFFIAHPIQDFITRITFLIWLHFVFGMDFFALAHLGRCSEEVGLQMALSHYLHHKLRHSVSSETVRYEKPHRPGEKNLQKINLRTK